MVLVPSLVVLFGLVLRGRFDEGAAPRSEPRPAGRGALASSGLAAAASASRSASCSRSSSSLRWGRIVGIPALFGFIVLGFVWLATAMAAQARD